MDVILKWYFLITVRQILEKKKKLFPFCSKFITSQNVGTQIFILIFCRKHFSWKYVPAPWLLSSGLWRVILCMDANTSKKSIRRSGWLLRQVLLKCYYLSNKNTQLDATISRKTYCFIVQTLLNMFRALLCPSSGVRQTAVAASGFRMNVEVVVVGWEHFHLHIHTENRGCNGSLTGSWWWA